MDRKARSQLRQQRLVTIVLSLLLVLILLWRLPINEIENSVPSNWVQQRFIDSLTTLRGDWLVKNEPSSLSWPSPDGKVHTPVRMSRRGWPLPQDGCLLLWRQLMGEPAEMLLVKQQWRSNHCRFSLNGGDEIHYYPDTGSVLLYN